MHVDPFIVLGSAIIGFLVGMTGAGGGALLMRPFGAAVHLRKGTVNLSLVKWMVAGSVPMAFVGSFLLKELGNSKSAQTNIERVLGAALLLGAAAMVLRYALDVRSGQRRKGVVHNIEPHPLRTILI